MISQKIRDELLRRVQKGAALLSEKEPNWAERINLKGLRQSGCESCVLGQVYGYFHKGLDALEVSSPVEYGFAAEEFEFYPTLDELWKDEIAWRLED